MACTRPHSHKEQICDGTTILNSIHYNHYTFGAAALLVETNQEMRQRDGQCARVRMMKRDFDVVHRQVTISAAQREQQDEMPQMRIHFIPEEWSSEWQAELPLQKLP